METVGKERIPEQGPGFVERFKEGVHIVSHGICNIPQFLSI